MKRPRCAGNDYAEARHKGADRPEVKGLSRLDGKSAVPPIASPNSGQGAITVRRDSGLMQVEKARALIAGCKSVDDVKSIRDQAEAMRSYMRQQKASLALQNDAAEIKVRCERRMGEMLIEAKENGGRDGGTGGDRKSQLHDATVIPTLGDLGIEKTAAKRWQDIARIPESNFDSYIADARLSGEVTSSGALSVARSLLRVDKEPEPFHILIALGEFKDAVRELAAAWPESEREALPPALRDLANEIGSDL